MKRENKNKVKVEAVIQIVLLITASLSFSYMVGEAFGLKGVELTSAQESAPGLTDEELTNLRESLPNYPTESNQELNNTLNDLQEQGCLQRSEFTNPEAVDSAIKQCISTAENNVAEGNGGTGLTSLLKAFGLLPSFSGASGGQIGQGLLDATGGLSYCPETKDGKICMPFATNECGDNCNEGCVEVDVETRRTPVGSSCELGICYDASEGICQTNSPKGECDDNQLSWYEASDTVARGLCARGCCIINNEANFITNGQCEDLARSVGYDLGTDNALFEGGITDEPACLAEAQRLKDSDLYGACTSPSDEPDKYECKFVTGDECLELTGQFNTGKLCSHPELDTVCTKQNSTSCSEGLDEIYWLDSCGNRENIYEGSSQAQRDLSWNDGETKTKEESCVLFDDGNPIANQGTCGNCDRFRGSICGNGTTSPIVQKLDDEAQDAVCLDTGCYDETGNKIRENGESWCAYQGKIGLDGILGNENFGGLGPSAFGINLPPLLSQLIGGNRAVDTVGSSHFRGQCIDGKITYTAGETGRAEICVESKTDIAGTSRQLSQAALTKNRAMECFQYNPSVAEGQAIGLAGPQNAWKILKLKLDLTCGMDPACFVKNIDLTEGSSDTFKFSYCLPKYKIGFELRDPESGQQVCSQASQKCTAVFVKVLSGLAAKWECQANCGCVEGNDPDSAKPSQKFIKEMNNFCTSMGDCGSSVNYAGQLPGGKGYSASMGKNSFSLFNFRDSFSFTDFLNLDALTTIGDAIPKPGEYIDSTKMEKKDLIPGSEGIVNQIDGMIKNFIGGGGGSQGTDYGVPDPSLGVEDRSLVMPGLVAGGAGGALLGIGYLTGGLAASTTATLSIGGLGGIPAGASVSASAATPLAGFAGALAGAGIGLATVGFLIDALGIGPGLSPGMAYGLMGAGAVGAGIMGYGAAQGLGSGTGFFAGAFANPIGAVLFIGAIVVLLIFKFMGIGEVKEVEVNFECSTWMPPVGVSPETCRACGNDELSDGSPTFPCNKYSCEALGEACAFVPGTEMPGTGGICEYSGKDDTSAPVITSLREDILSDNYEYQNVDLDTRVFEVRKEGEECLDQFESVTFGFTTDEYATKCAISGTPRESIEQMVAIGAGRNHTYTFNSQNLEGLGIDGLNEEERNEIKLYIACQDLKGNTNIAHEYAVEMCIVPRDLTPTLILDYAGLQGLLAPHEAIDKDLTFTVNEPSECRWDVVETSFDAMENEATCNSLLQCSATIPIEQDENAVCIKCLDHPEWEGTPREGERNENTQCISATISRTDALEITSITPDNETIKRGSGDSVINVEVETRGGVDGTADCYWDLDNEGEYPFFETAAMIHKQPLGGGTVRLSAGTYNLKIRCEDAAGNIARNETNFILDIDAVAPQVTRVYANSGNLYVITNEQANCAFVNSPPATSAVCGFHVDGCSDIEGCELMSVDSSEEGYGKSSASFDISKTYYIRCEDLFGNEPSQCNLVVSGGII